MPDDDDDDAVADEIDDVETGGNSGIEDESETSDDQIAVDYADGSSEEFQTEESGDADDDDDSGDAEGDDSGYGDGQDDTYEDQGEVFDQ